MDKAKRNDIHRRFVYLSSDDVSRERSFACGVLMGRFHELEAAGFKAVIPHDVVDAGDDWQPAMRQSIREMLRVRAGRPVYDGVAELPGLFGSRGARCERGVCGQLGIPHKTVGEWCAEGAAS